MNQPVTPGKSRPGRWRSATSGPIGFRLALVVALAALVAAGGWWAFGRSDAETAADVTAATQGGDGQDVAPSADPGNEAAIVDCDADQLVELLRSGQPAHDYQPAGGYREAAAASELVVSGTVTGIVRAPSPDQADVAYTELSVTDVRGIDGEPVSDVDVVAYRSWWADRATEDPLAEALATTDLRFVGFLMPWSGVRGGYHPGVEGLYVGCGSLDAPAVAVIESAAGPGDPMAPTLAELVVIASDPFGSGVDGSGTTDAPDDGDPTGGEPKQGDPKQGDPKEGDLPTEHAPPPGGDL